MKKIVVLFNVLILSLLVSVPLHASDWIDQSRHYDEEGGSLFIEDFYGYDALENERRDTISGKSRYRVIPRVTGLNANKQPNIHTVISWNAVPNVWGYKINYYDYLNGGSWKSLNVGNTLRFSAHLDCNAYLVSISAYNEKWESAPSNVILVGDYYCPLRIIN